MPLHHLDEEISPSDPHKRLNNIVLACNNVSTSISLFIIHYSTSGPRSHIHILLEYQKVDQEVDTENTGSMFDGKENVCDGEWHRRKIEDADGVLDEVIVKVL
ncbi:hypothetical protein Tco_0010199 [Tanacetum coccineum]